MCDKKKFGEEFIVLILIKGTVFPLSKFMYSTAVRLNKEVGCLIKIIRKIKIILFY